VGTKEYFQFLTQCNLLPRSHQINFECELLLGSPEEVSSAVTWLLSEGASYVTGSVVCVDGGGECRKKKNTCDLLRL
jgi:NAD(P)-dependent dehydrogenase (short-subunit alcohol dehydrogenase family)